MKKQIDKSQTKAIFTFTPGEYVLVKCDNEMYGDWTLNNLIDRSEKGKDPDIGLPRIYLTEDEKELLVKEGFLEVG